MLTTGQPQASACPSRTPGEARHPRPHAPQHGDHQLALDRHGVRGSIIDRMDHLVDLGVTAVSVMPVNQFSGRHGWGYDGVGLFAVHDPYGGPAGGDGPQRLLVDPADQEDEAEKGCRER